MGHEVRLRADTVAALPERPGDGLGTAVDAEFREHALDGDIAAWGSG